MKELSNKDRKLLLADLCARLLYGVIVQIPELFCASKTIDVKLDAIFKVDDDFHFTDDYGYLIENIKPYLRPMSSMTEEERKEYDRFIMNGGLGSAEHFDWLNSHHFDYRGLIEKGLALEAPEEMYKL